MKRTLAILVYAITFIAVLIYIGTILDNLCNYCPIIQNWDYDSVKTVLEGLGSLGGEVIFSWRNES